VSELEPHAVLPGTSARGSRLYQNEARRCRIEQGAEKTHAAVLPSLFAGMRLAIGFGWRVGPVAEASGSLSGVGFKLKQSVDLMHTPEVFAWSVSVIVTMIMLAIEGAMLSPLETYVFRWRKPTHRSTPTEFTNHSTEGAPADV
jgi:hypothetical protein